MLNWHENLSVEMVQAHSESGRISTCYKYGDADLTKHNVQTAHWIRRRGGDYPELCIGLLCVIDDVIYELVTPVLFPVFSDQEITWRPVDKDGCPVDIQV